MIKKINSIQFYILIVWKRKFSKYLYLVKNTYHEALRSRSIDNGLSIYVCAFISAQDRVCYTGTELSNPYRHDGQLSPAVGVHNIQLLRANRDSITATYNFGWTYNHQPMMCYWNGKFYLHFLCDSTDEHIPPSHTVLMTSPDGIIGVLPKFCFRNIKYPKVLPKRDEPILHTTLQPSCTSV